MFSFGLVFQLEIIMSWNHGLIQLSVQFLSLFLEWKGMDESNLTQDDRLVLLQEFVQFAVKFRKDSVRILKVDTEKYLERYTWVSHDGRHRFFEPHDRPTRDSFPICVIVPNDMNANEMADPLTLMCRTGNHDMVRRLCSLFVDVEMEKDLSDVEIVELRKLVENCLDVLVMSGQSEDVGFVLFLVEKVLTEEQVVNVLMDCATIPKKKELEKECDLLNEFHGYDMQAKAPSYVIKRLPFVQAIVPACVERIGCKIRNDTWNEVTRRLNDDECWNHCPNLAESVRHVFFQYAWAVL